MGFFNDPVGTFTRTIDKVGDAAGKISRSTMGVVQNLANPVTDFIDETLDKLNPIRFKSRHSVHIDPIQFGDVNATVRIPTDYTVRFGLAENPLGGLGPLAQIPDATGGLFRMVATDTEELREAAERIRYLSHVLRFGGYRDPSRESVYLTLRLYPEPTATEDPVDCLAVVRAEHKDVTLCQGILEVVGREIKNAKRRAQSESPVLALPTPGFANELPGSAIRLARSFGFQPPADDTFPDVTVSVEFFNPTDGAQLTGAAAKIGRIELALERENEFVREELCRLSVRTPQENRYTVKFSLDNQPDYMSELKNGAARLLCVGGTCPIEKGGAFQTVIPRLASANETISKSLIAALVTKEEATGENIGQPFARYVLQALAMREVLRAGLWECRQSIRTLGFNSRLVDYRLRQKVAIANHSPFPQTFRLRHEYKVKGGGWAGGRDYPEVTIPRGAVYVATVFPSANDPALGFNNKFKLARVSATDETTDDIKAARDKLCAISLLAGFEGAFAEARSARFQRGAAASDALLEWTVGDAHS